MVWHPIVPICPECDVHARVNMACMNAEGKLRVVGICPKCNHRIECEVSLEEIVANCKELDEAAATNKGEIDLTQFEQTGKPH